ncbi:MAG: response regulator, partial [Lachnospiraceae bacterium]|nr:response regulator [Lachnospiraceae bacterium]
MIEHRYTVVVAEDEELLLNNLVAKIQATELGFDVVGTAQTGIQAYDLVKELNPDLLITDIRMPAMNGIALLEKVRESYPLMKFIIVSGFSDFEYARSAIQLQVSEYLLKPI